MHATNRFFDSRMGVLRRARLLIALVVGAILFIVLWFGTRPRRTDYGVWNADLQRAIQNGDNDYILRLFDRGKDVVHAKVYVPELGALSAWTYPVHCAAMNAQPTIVDTLLSNGADANAQDSLSLTAPVWLAISGAEAEREREVFEVLHRHQVALDRPTGPRGWTPLHYSVHYGCIEATERLLEFGAAINAGDIDGNTPLHIAAMGWNLERLLNTSRVLVKHGAKKDLRNRAGKVPIEVVAAEFRSAEVRELLQ